MFNLHRLAPPKWVRYAMYFIICVMGASSLIQLVFVHRAEDLRKSDVAILSLAANQATLSQRVIRFAMAFQRDNAEQELRTSVHELITQGKQLDLLMQEEILSPSDASDHKRNHISLAYTSWQRYHRTLIQEGSELVALMEIGDMEPAGVLSSTLQITAGNNLAAVNDLYSAIDGFVNSRNNNTLTTINRWIKINLFAIVLSFILVEPILALIKRQYQRLLEQAHQLETIAAEREKDAAAALVEAETTSRLALEEKVMFIAIGSHDLRTPLQTILSTVDFMLIRSRTTGLQEDELDINLSKLEIACKHVEGIARDLGEFVRDSEGYGREEKKIVGLSQCLLNIYDIYFDIAEAKGLDFSLSEEHRFDFIKIEENMLNRILSNLISNAIKYTQTGSVKVATRNPDQNHLEIIVSDTGIGIHPELIEKISKPFFRTAESRLVSQQGLGLGLAIVDRFIKFMGGKLEITSTQGAGSTFKALLPIEIQTKAAQIAQDARDSGFQEINFSASVVYVDDDLSLIYDLTRITKALSEKLTVQGFTNTDEALQYIVAHPVDCVFTDLQMHPIDGYQFASRVKALNLPYPYLVAMSAYNIQPHQKVLFDAFVAKPISSQSITEILQSSRKRHPS